MNKEPKLVDLGLPSGNLWMKYNLGANSEGASGNHYQFGSLVGYSSNEEIATIVNNWEVYPFNDGEEFYNDEYFIANRSKWFYKNGILKPDFDIVTQTYGKGFKIPEPKDFQELLDNTTNCLYMIIDTVTNKKINGRLFESKINNNTIFFPESNINTIQVGNIGGDCSVWSSRIFTDLLNGSGYSVCFYCTDLSSLYGFFSYRSRVACLPIRGIKYIV